MKTGQMILFEYNNQLANAFVDGGFVTLEEFIDKELNAIAQQHDEIELRRVIACVNACAGSSTEGLEEMVAEGRSVANMAMLYGRAMDRRDELLAALKAVISDVDKNNHVTVETYILIDAAIAKSTV